MLSSWCQESTTTLSLFLPPAPKAGCDKHGLKLPLEIDQASSSLK